MKNLADCFGQHGWREFLSNRQQLLAEYDRSREQTTNRPVKVAHGVAFEAAVRRWFSEFLPKKFGVTAGYVVPDLYDEELNLYHFDVIIYDALNAPILWTEGTAGDSEHGKSRAIPARHVVGLYEVKARLTSTSVREALDKLGQAGQFCDQVHKNFRCAVIFAELSESENTSEKILHRLLEGKDILGFSGGVVLRYEGDETSTGLIFFTRTDGDKGSSSAGGESPIQGGPLAKPIDSLAIYRREDGSLELGEQNAGAELMCVKTGQWAVSKFYGRTHGQGPISVKLTWSRGNFARFCIEMVAALEGVPRNAEQRLSFGRVFDNVTVLRAPLQCGVPEAGRPFVVASLFGGGPEGEKISTSRSGDELTVTIWIQLENRGSAPTEVSDDGFVSKVELAPGSKAVKSISMKMVRTPGVSDLDPLKVHQRILGRSTDADQTIVAIEHTIILDESEPRLVPAGQSCDPMQIG